MGDLWGDGELDEKPVSEEIVAAFALGRYAITNTQFLSFLNAGERAAARRGIGFNRNNPLYKEGGVFFCKAGYENYPVTYVSWVAATNYCEWLSLQTGKHFYLPTEVQWQYASTGGRDLKWSLGDVFDAANYICAQDGPGPADDGEPTVWGLYNMTGNVFEWCHDEYRFSLADEAQHNMLTSDRVIKGGAFILADPPNFRNAKRFSCHQDSCLSSVGFRVAAG